MPDERPISIATPRTEADRAWLCALWQSRWGGERMAVRERVYALADLEALMAWRGGDPVGAVTFARDGDEAEIVSLNTVVAGAGIGTALLDAACAAARSAGAGRLVAVTTNENLGALAFYLRRGFRLESVRLGAVDRARAVKPSIPLAAGGIEIHDEWVLARPLA
jgi:GNAT superfamily N-acetyltransferase